MYLDILKILFNSIYYQKLLQVMTKTSKYENNLKTIVVYKESCSKYINIERTVGNIKN